MLRRAPSPGGPASPPACDGSRPVSDRRGAPPERPPGPRPPGARRGRGRERIPPPDASSSRAGAGEQVDGRFAALRLLAGRAYGGDDGREELAKPRRCGVAARPLRGRRREDAGKGTTGGSAIDPVLAHPSHGVEGQVLPAPSRG